MFRFPSSHQPGMEPIGSPSCLHFKDMRPCYMFLSRNPKPEPQPASILTDITLHFLSFSVICLEAKPFHPPFSTEAYVQFQK
eukprot:scaffold226603_cov18-Tisochrysis_lutea.AAC.1